jgi:hypothetical protein
MLIKDNGQSNFMKNNNSTAFKGFKLPLSNINSQSRNYKNTLLKEKNIRKYSLYSTKEATPREEYNKVIIPKSGQKTLNQPMKEKCDKNELDDSLSQISQLLNKEDLNYSSIIAKIPGINEEENFVYDQLIFNKSRINKAKILSHKIGILKLPISKISSKESLISSDRGKKCFSDRIQETEKINKKEKNSDDIADTFCCFFGKK